MVFGPLDFCSRGLFWSNAKRLQERTAIHSIAGEGAHVRRDFGAGEIGLIAGDLNSYMVNFG